MSYLNLNLKPCKVPDDGVSWYNLDTNRRITKLTNKVGLTDPPVAASNWPIIAEFIELNDIPPSDIKYMNESHSRILLDAMKDRLHPSVSMVKTNDIENVSDEVLSTLDTFSFSRINAKAKVLYVVDGDTIDVGLILSPKELCVSHWSRRNKQMCQTQLVRICGDSSDDNSSNVNLDGGILMKLRLRLYGIDTAEKDTVQGQRCKDWSILKYNELNNIVYVTLMGTDARGRTLANIYESPNSDRSINQLLIDHTDPFYGKLCVPYYGETKDADFTKRTTETVKDSKEKEVCLTSGECFDPKNINTNMDAWIPGSFSERTGFSQCGVSDKEVKTESKNQSKSSGKEEDTSVPTSDKIKKKREDRCIVS